MTDSENGGATERAETVPSRPEPVSEAGPEDGIDRSRAWLVGVGLGALALAAMVISFVIGTNYSDDPAPVAAGAGDVPALPQDVSGPGKDLFTASCGACHVLAEAGTDGAVGPDLDSLAPSEALTAEAIAKGGAGSGLMPPGLLTGKEAGQVSEYVAAATGGG